LRDGMTFPSSIQRWVQVQKQSAKAPDRRGPIAIRLPARLLWD
jgi:hypothetical protein